MGHAGQLSWLKSVGWLAASLLNRPGVASCGYLTAQHWVWCADRWAAMAMCQARQLRLTCCCLQCLLPGITWLPCPSAQVVHAVLGAIRGMAGGKAEAAGAARIGMNQLLEVRLAGLLQLGLCDMF